MISFIRTIAIYVVSGVVVLTIAYTTPTWAQALDYCVVGSTVTITGVIDRVRQRPDGKAWAFTIRDKKSEPCKADGIILSDSTRPGECGPGRRITATGKVHLFNPKNPNSQIIETSSVKCR